MTAFYGLFTYTEQLKQAHHPFTWDEELCSECGTHYPCDVIKLINFIERNF